VAVARALNRSIGSGRTIMAREMAGDMGLQVGVVKDAIKQKDATPSRLEAKLATSLKRIPLIDFKAKGPEPSRGKGRGVGYRIGGQTKRLDHAFIATMRSGHRGVFLRKGDRRLPIREAFGPSLGHVFIKFRPMGIARCAEQLRKNLVSEFRFVMSRAAA
jgi:hypothetical protein